ncbi:MAG: LON peptidase substrate-binding domain-containing protein, partial [Treponema sp.]|nr:LON peptidase substrate-binding domain-containing protein [Treponema sp.]
MTRKGNSKKNGVGKFLSGFFGKNILLADYTAIEDHELSVETFPMLPLRDLVLFPDTVVSIFIRLSSDIAALEEALSRENRIFAVALKKLDFGYSNEPWETGTVVRIINRLKLPDNTFRVVLQCEYRAAILSINPQENFTMVKVEPLKTISLNEPFSPDDLALMRSVQKSFTQYADLSKRISADTLSAVEKTESPERMANLVCNSSYLKFERKLELLRYANTRERLLAILETLEKENEIYGIQKNITGKVRKKMEKRHREYILNEQLREINKELGKDKVEDEYAILEKRIAEKNPPAEVTEKTDKEIKRLKKLQPLSPEAGVLRGYLEWIADLPWSSYTVDSGDLGDAEKILDEDHFGMRKAKDRILEFIAVRQLLGNEEITINNEQLEISNEKIEMESKELGTESEVIISETDPHSSIAHPIDHSIEHSSIDHSSIEHSPLLIPHSIKGPILCFVGPPGTGKTSLGKSVARALGRNFIRISLGGVRDEAEIRGHRKTYVGALPGKIIQSLRKAGTVNPVFLLDEIDKLSSDFRGDPASALLEVLDPEQNSTFVDHYLEVQYDLSKVMFITTANSLHTIPYPLLDRMEIIEVPGYGENEKLTIAKQFLIPKELKNNGLSSAKIT